MQATIALQYRLDIYTMPILPPKIYIIDSVTDDKTPNPNIMPTMKIAAHIFLE